MINYLDKIKEIINQKFEPEYLLLKDNSSLHNTHKSFDRNKFHLKLTIKSKKMQSLTKLQAHRLIFESLKNEMKDKIHALEIDIK
tara:strand:+ start:27 stop:281 length:255 start_codon:yes stop_codon:yes gene_type:complete